MKAWQAGLLGLAMGVGVTLLATRVVRAAKPTVADILSNPEGYRGKSVTLVGTVVKPNDYPAIDDGTGVLPLYPATTDISNKIAGLLDQRAKVWGTIEIYDSFAHLYTLGILTA